MSPAEVGVRRGHVVECFVVPLVGVEGDEVPQRKSVYGYSLWMLFLNLNEFWQRYVFDMFFSAAHYIC